MSIEATTVCQTKQACGQSGQRRQIVAQVPKDLRNSSLLVRNAVGASRVARCGLAFPERLLSRSERRSARYVRLYTAEIATPMRMHSRKAEAAESAASRRPMLNDTYSDTVAPTAMKPNTVPSPNPLNTLVVVWHPRA